MTCFTFLILLLSKITPAVSIMDQENPQMWCLKLMMGPPISFGKGGILEAFKLVYLFASADY